MNMSVVSYYQPSVVTDPRNGSFYFPSFSISSGFSSILSFRFSTICFMRNNQVYSTLFKSFTKRIRICCFIINKSLYCLSWPPSFANWFTAGISVISNHLHNCCFASLIPIYCSSQIFSPFRFRCVYLLL